jgi:hypothetical protein
VRIRHDERQASAHRKSGFREHLKRSEEFGPSGEGQQQSLWTYFSGIHNLVIMLPTEQIGKLQYRYRKKNDAALKARLAGSRLRHWKFVESLFALWRVKLIFAAFYQSYLVMKKSGGSTSYG